MKKKIYSNLFMDNNLETVAFQKRISDSPVKQNLRYSNRLSNVLNDGSAKFSSQNKEEKKFSSSNINQGNKIDDVYTNLNIDFLVNNPSLKNTNSSNLNVNQSININDTKNLTVGGNDKMNISKFNSSSPIAKENTSAMIPKLNLIGNNRDNLLDDLSFLNNVSLTNRKNSNKVINDNNNFYENGNNNYNLNFNMLNANSLNSLSNLNNMGFNNLGNNLTNNKSIEISSSDNLRNFNSSNSQNNELKRSLDLLNNNLTNILNSQKIEDIFNPKTIKNQLRGTVLVRAILIIGKRHFGKY